VTKKRKGSSGPEPRPHGQPQSQLLSSDMEQTSEGIAVSDLNGVVLFVNKTFARMHGYESHEVIGRHLSIFHTPDQMSKVEHANRQLQQTGIFEGEISHARRDGTPFQTTMHNSLLRDDSGKPIGMIGMLLDTTQHKRAEAILHEQTQRLQQAEHIARMGFWDWNLQSNRVYFSDGVIRLYGLETGEDMEVGELAKRVVHPDDLTFVKEDLDQAARGERHLNIDHRIVRPEGEIRWVHAQAELVRDEDGNPESLLGTAIDITDRRQIDERLLFLSQVTEQVADSILATDLDYKIAYTNSAFGHLFGYNSSEVLGKSPNILNAESDAAKIQAEIYHAVTSGDVWAGEVMNRKKDGSVFPCELIVFPLVDEQGVIFAYAGSQRDITDRRLAEDKLRQNARELEERHIELQEKNTALNQILDHIEKERQEYKHHICREIESECLPVLQRAKVEAAPASVKALDRLIKRLKDSLDRDIDVFQDRLSRLTSRELEICDLIKIGRTSKEICALLSLSLTTVSTHRQNIRKKLGITSKGVNLGTFLRIR